MKTKLTAKRDKGRNSIGKILPEYLLHILLTPAFLPFIISLSSCDGIDKEPLDAGTEIAVTKSPNGELHHIDLLFFNDDKLQKLDSYQRHEYTGQARINGTSKRGSKILAAVANKQGEMYSWDDMESFLSFSKTTVNLDEDSPEWPVMTGLAIIEAGSDKEYNLALSPLMSKIKLRSICCDFTGKAYQNQVLKDVKVYLTNVHHRWALFSDVGENEYMNIGGVNHQELDKMDNPGYVYSKVKGDVGKSVRNVDISLYCYPNTLEEESMGSPFTRLVIEGKIGDETCYYPLTVNRKNDGNGVERNMEYIYDVLLTRKGCKSPDTSVDRDMAQVSVSVSNWDEKGKHYVSF